MLTVTFLGFSEVFFFPLFGLVDVSSAADGVKNILQIIPSAGMLDFWLSNLGG